MRGLMMHAPLLISDLISRAERYHGDTEIVSRSATGQAHRYTYAAAHARARRLARALARLGVKAGDRAATLAWNGYRHFECYYAVSGSGAVMHTINPRLFPEQIAWIANDAEDSVLFFDATFVPLVEQLASQLKRVRAMCCWASAPTCLLRHPFPVCFVTKICWQLKTRSMRGPNWRRRLPAACATPRVRQVIPRACSIIIAAPCCTHS